MNILIENKNGCDVAEELTESDKTKLLKAKKIYLVEGIIYRRTSEQDEPVKKPKRTYKTKVVKAEG